MAKKIIPVYNICSIQHDPQHPDLLIQRLAPYLQSHYHNLHSPHRHSFYHLVLFTKGKGTHTIDFESFPVKAFQIYFMVPGQVHGWKFQNDVDGYIIHFNEALFSSFLLNNHFLERFTFFSGRATDGVCQLPATIQQTVAALFETLLYEIDKGPASSIDMIRIKLIELFITAERSCSSASQAKLPQHKQTLLRSFQQLINKNYNSIRLPKEYASLLYVTPNHLNALCQELMGKTAGDLIRDRILLEAKRLLTNADLTATQIAYELNFRDNSYFNRFFKQYEGKTPDEFRKKYHHLKSLNHVCVYYLLPAQFYFKYSSVEMYPLPPWEYVRLQKSLPAEAHPGDEGCL